MMNLNISIKKDESSLIVTVPVDAELDDIRKAVAAQRGGIEYTHVRFVLGGEFVSGNAKVSEYDIKEGDTINAMISTVVSLVTP
jgi:hypothetical protein